MIDLPEAFWKGRIIGSEEWNWSKPLETNKAPMLIVRREWSHRDGGHEEHCSGYLLAEQVQLPSKVLEKV